MDGKGLDSYIGKTISVFWNDGERVTRHDGILKSANGIELILSRPEGDECLLYSRVVRIDLRR
jgi:hypothetical protein